MYLKDRRWDVPWDPTIDQRLADLELRMDRRVRELLDELKGLRRRVDDESWKAENRFWVLSRVIPTLMLLAGLVLAGVLTK